MTNVNKNERFIPLKNYVIAFVVVVVIIALTFYGFAWYKVVKESRVSESYLVKEKVISKEINDLNEVDVVFIEPPATYFIYVSYTGDEPIYNMEKEMKDVINEYHLNDSFYYLNVTSIKEANDLIEQVNEALHLEEKKINKVPTIIYFKDGKVVDMITREDDSLITSSDLEKLLDRNHIKK